MEVTWDKSSGMGYIRLHSDDAHVGISATTVPLDCLRQDEPDTMIGSLNLDFDSDGRLVGIEVFDVESTLRPSLLQQARVIG